MKNTINRRRRRQADTSCLLHACSLARSPVFIFLFIYYVVAPSSAALRRGSSPACRESFTRSFVGALSVIWNERGDSRQQTSPPYPLPHPPSRFDQTSPRRGANSVLPPASHFQSTPFCRLQWNVTSSTKPEAHNVSRRKGRLQVKICGWADMASVDREPIKGGWSPYLYPCKNSSNLYQFQERPPAKVGRTCPPQSTLWRCHCQMP